MVQWDFLVCCLGAICNVLCFHFETFAPCSSRAFFTIFLYWELYKFAVYSCSGYCMIEEMLYLWHSLCKICYIYGVSQGAIISPGTVASGGEPRSLPTQGRSCIWCPTVTTVHVLPRRLAQLLFPDWYVLVYWPLQIPSWKEDIFSG